MQTDHLGQIIFSDEDLFDLVMKGQNLYDFKQILVDESVDFTSVADVIDSIPNVVKYNSDQSMDIHEFDRANQRKWFMPKEYLDLDIAEYILSLCDKPEQLQRVGQELLLYQEKNLFNLLRYLKYLVDVMTKHNIIWGVGRGSSVASYVLFLLGVHKIDSLYYDLDPTEFLR